MAVGLIALETPTRACGPFFPYTLLDEGDSALLRAPMTAFHEELIRLKVVPPPYPHQPANGNYDEQTSGVETQQLVEALTKLGYSPSRIKEAIDDYRMQRSILQSFTTVHEAWAEARDLARAENVTTFTNIEPLLLPITLPEILPVEFRDYFEGAMAYHQEDFAGAAKAWERLLARPINARRYRSTWAAFMLGRMNWEMNPGLALASFKNLRQMVDRGWADPLGLAVTSLGWEARIYLRQKDYLQAIVLYLEQFATGVESAESSLRFAVGEALESGDRSLEKLAKDFRARRVVTAFLLSGYADLSIDVDSRAKHFAMDLLGKSSYARARVVRWHRTARSGLLWLEALENAEVADLAPAEELALTAYQAGEWDLCQRWIRRSPQSAICQWLQAKLCLREGRLNDAALALAPAVRSLPVLPEFHSREQPLAARTGCETGQTAAQLLLGEYGAMQLARRQFVEALDALFRAGFWTDAAYVAECVLTLEELRKYVDERWPDPDGPERTLALRALLARRLARQTRYTEARLYARNEQRSDLRTLASDLASGTNTNLEAALRARALFDAACLLRTNGLELIGTELEPDWFIYGGQYDWGLGATERQQLVGKDASAPSAEEMRRAAEHHPVIDQRFHYRYVAADLAWQAAAMLPNNDETTAQILWTAGSWLKERDPISADRFYKALVRRCRRTELGTLADRLRWFPPAKSVAVLATSEQDPSAAAPVNP